MGESLKGKVAVITGSGQGIGRSIAMHMAQQGASVVTNNRKPGSTGFAIMNDNLANNLDAGELEKLKKKAEAASGDAETTAKAIRDAGGKAEAFFGDVSNFDIARKLIETAVNKFGGVDILVNVVGTFAFSPIWEMSEETWDKVCLIKPKAHFNCTRHALPYMMEKKSGTIINCSSGAFKGGPLRQSNYSAANAGVIGLTYATAQEVFPYGITCNAFAPGAQTRASFELDAYGKAMPEGKEPWFDESVKQMVTNSPSPDDVAPFISYLATDDASNINGSVFFVMGGMVALYSEADFLHVITKEGRWSMDELKKKVPADLMKDFQSTTMKMMGAEKK